MRYTTLLFDLDHTLFDSDTSHDAAFEAAMQDVALDDPWSVFPTFDAINQALWRRVERHELRPDDVKVQRFQALLDECGLDGDAQRMGALFAEALTGHGDLYPGARNLLDDLAPHARLCLVTNGIGSVQRGRLRRLGLTDVFDAVVISGEVGTSKPGTQIFDIALEALDGPDRRRCVMIGDNLGSDVRGGQAAGIDTIWFNPGRHPLDGCRPPTHEIRALDEIVHIVAPPVE